MNDEQHGADAPPKTSIEKTLEVIEQMASEAGGSPVAAFLVPMVKQRLPSDPQELDAQLAKYAQLLLMMRSDGAQPEYSISPHPFHEGAPNGATPGLPAPCQS